MIHADTRVTKIVAYNKRFSSSDARRAYNLKGKWGWIVVSGLDGETCKAAWGLGG